MSCALRSNLNATTQANRLKSIGLVFEAPFLFIRRQPLFVHACLFFADCHQIISRAVGSKKAKGQFPPPHFPPDFSRLSRSGTCSIKRYLIDYRHFLIYAANGRHKKSGKQKSHKSRLLSSIILKERKIG